MKSKHIHFSRDHLGGCLCHIHYLNRLGLGVNFYTDKAYHHELKIWAKENIKLCDIREYKDNGYDAWMGYNRYWHNHPERWNYNKVMLDWFEYFSKRINVKNPLESMDDLLFDEMILNNQSGYSYGCNYLVIDGKPRSNQIRYNKGKFEELEQKLEGMVISSERMRKRGMNLMDIAILASRSEFVIGIHTAPMLVTFNSLSISKVKGWLVFDNEKTFTFNDRIHLLNRFDQIKYYLPEIDMIDKSSLHRIKYNIKKFIGGFTK